MEAIAAVLMALVAMTGCRAYRPDPRALVFLVDASPNSLDPRVGTDGQSEHIDELIFDGLVERDVHYQYQPALALRWENPDSKTMVFHLRSGVRFQNGQRLTARDVVWTLDTMRNGKPRSPKSGSYLSVESVEARDAETVVFHLRRPDNFLLENLATNAMGVVPYGSGADFWRHPVGTGAFRVVSQQIDQEIVLERNTQGWRAPPKIERVRFRVVPDAVTRALELKKGSGDVAINTLPNDALPVLAKDAKLGIVAMGGTPLQYIGFNLRDPILKDTRVRQAIALAIDRGQIVNSLLRGHARPANSVLPEGHWAYWAGADVPRYGYDPARASQLLDAAGYRADKGGIRLRLTMKTSTDEEPRLLAAVLQQQLAAVGIALDIRSNEFGTFYADIAKGSFQMYSLRWVGGNESPSIFGYAFSTARMPPNGANRGRYNNAELDALLNDAATAEGQDRQRADYRRAQAILAADLPAINLWYRDTVLVHNRRLTGVELDPSGTYTFLRTASLTP